MNQAIKIEQRKNIIIVPSHWYYNGQDTSLKVRELNNLPLNTIEEMNQGIFDISWCERYQSDGSLEQLLGQGLNCPHGFSRITLMETFDEVREEFNIGYAQRIRGGIEQFGVLPDLGIEILAAGPVSYQNGGLIEVKHGELQGAKLFVRSDAHPGEPESYSYQTSYRHQNSRDPNTDETAIRPFNEFTTYDDHLISAWFDFNAMIGIQKNSKPDTEMPKLVNAVSDSVYFGPYRTLFNAPATITIPIDRTKVSDASKIQAYIFNDLSQTFDPLFSVPGGTTISVDINENTASFDTQVLGVFVLGIK